MFTAKLLLVSLMFQASAIVFGKPSLFGTIYKGLTGIQRAKCHQLQRSSANVQFPSYCKPGSLRVQYLDVGGGFIRTNSFSYFGNVLRTFDVQFITEQDGAGSIVAKFNGAILNCKGWAAHKRKTCTIPRKLRPWAGVITVSIGNHPSTRFQMSGTPVCPSPGFTGYNCDQDINECVVHKDKVLCAWKDGCVNTYGGYKCKCPLGYKVSSKDFRLCEKDIPQILSRSSNITVFFYQTATLPCRYSASGPVAVSWRINNKIIAIKRTDGTKQTINRRLTLDNSGDLMIHNTTFEDAGRFICIVQNVRFYSGIIHDLRTESVHTPQVTCTKLVKNVIVDCQVVGLPLPTVTWSHGQQLITPSARRTIILGPLSNAPAFLKGATLQLQLRIKGIQKADAGVYSCKAVNRHGVIINAVTLRV